MSEWDTLIEILEQSVERNGEKPLTNLWLLNILKMHQRWLERQDDDSAQAERRAFSDCYWKD